MIQEIDHDENSGKDIAAFDCVEDKKTTARKKNEKSLWFLLKRDKIYRKKYILTVAYILSFLTLVSYILYVSVVCKFYDLIANISQENEST